MGYAPLTRTSNFFVGIGKDFGEKSSFLAHNFALVPHPQWVERPFHTLLSLSEFFSPSINDIDENVEANYVHPLCRFAMRLFGIPIGATPEHTTLIDRSVFADSHPRASNDAASLRARRLDTVSTGVHPTHEDDDEKDLDDYLQVVIDHPPFLFAIKDGPGDADPGKDARKDVGKDDSKEV